MDEKTRELRDIFMGVAGEESVTERQEEGRGSLADTTDEGDREAAVRSLVAEMRERFAFETGLDDDALVRVVRGYFGGESDAEVAEALSAAKPEVFRARLDLHLLRESDTHTPFDLDELRPVLDGDESVEAATERLEVDESTVRHYAAVLRARTEARGVADRFRAEFEDLFTDAAAAQLTAATRRDGLEDATEGGESESDISL
jgi:hypothetical protein